MTSNTTPLTIQAIKVTKRALDQIHARLEEDLNAIAQTVDPKTPFVHPDETETLKRLVVTDAIADLENNLWEIAHQECSLLVAAATLLVPEDTRSAVIERAAKTWPWSPITPPQRKEAYLFASLRTLVLKQTIPSSTQPDGSILHGQWPDVRPLRVLKWVKERLSTHEKKRGDAYEQHYQRQTHLPGGPHLPGLDLKNDCPTLAQEGHIRIISPQQLAHLCHATFKVDEDRRKPAIHIDAGKAHHDLILGVRKTITASGGAIKRRHKHRKTRQVERDTGRVSLLIPGHPTQMWLPLEGGTLSDWMMQQLSVTLGPLGLRVWTALLSRLSDEGRTGYFRFTFDGVIDAMNLSKRSRERPDVRQRILSIINLLTQIELQVDHPKHPKWSSRPLFLIGGRFGKIDGTKRTIEGLELIINPLLYDGVRDPIKKTIGKNFSPAPKALAHINHERHPYAHLMGLLLAIRFRLAHNDGKDYIRLTGQTLLQLAGIPYTERKAKQSWTRLTRELSVLKQAGLLGTWTWKDAPHTLSGRCTITASAWIRDRTLHGVKPLEALPESTVPKTGNEIRTWRKGKGWTQTQASFELKISKRTLIRAEQRGTTTLTNHLIQKLHAKLVEPSTRQGDKKPPG